MSLQLWLFTLIKSELWGISLSPISVFLFPPCSQLPLPSFLPSFLQLGLVFLSSLFFLIYCHWWLRRSCWMFAGPLWQKHTVSSLSSSLYHITYLFVPHRPFSPSSYSALRLKEERIEASGVKDRPPSCTELQCRFLSTQDRKRTLVSPAATWLSLFLCPASSLSFCCLMIEQT